MSAGGDGQHLGGVAQRSLIHGGAGLSFVTRLPSRIIEWAGRPAVQRSDPSAAARTRTHARRARGRASFGAQDLRDRVDLLVRARVHLIHYARVVVCVLP